MNLKEQLKKYWKFLSKHSFGEHDTINFFQNGSFAIITRTGVNYYDENCQQVDFVLGERFAILASGVTIKIESDKVEILRSGIHKCSETLYISKEKGSSVFVSGSLVIVKDYYSSQYNIYLIKKTVNPYQVSVSQLSLEFPPCRSIYHFEASEDNSIFAIGFGFDRGGNLSSCKKLYKLELGSFEVTDITPTAFDNLHVMKCGSYIVNYKGCCKMYSADGKLILTSDEPRGIIGIGYDIVRFDNSLVVNAVSGSVICKADMETSNMTKKTNFYIGRYIIRAPDGKVGYLLDGKLLPSICGSRLSQKLSVIYQQGTFYPTTFDENDDIAGYQPDVYYSRLKSMIPR